MGPVRYELILKCCPKMVSFTRRMPKRPPFKSLLTLLRNVQVLQILTSIVRLVTHFQQHVNNDGSVIFLFQWLSVDLGIILSLSLCLLPV